MVLIRSFLEKDRQEIAALHTRSWQSAYAEILPSQFLTQGLASQHQQHWQRAILSDDDVVLVAEFEGKLIGFIAIWAGESAYIDNLHIDPELRSQGLGKRLLLAAFEGLIDRGCSTAYLWVFKENRAAIRFYKRLGAEIGAEEEKTFFGNRITNIRLYWSDLEQCLQQVAT